MSKSKKNFDYTLDARYDGVNIDAEPALTIRLPDGREFNVPELLAQCRRDNVTGHIKTFQKNPDKKKPTGRFNAKYDAEETAWILQATREEVQEKYKVDHVRALAILRYVYNKVGRTYKTPFRKPDKRTHPD